LGHHHAGCADIPLSCFLLHIYLVLLHIILFLFISALLFLYRSSMVSVSCLYAIRMMAYLWIFIQKNKYRNKRNTPLRY